MFGSVTGNGSMDSVEFAKNFLTAFDVHVMHYNFSIDTGMQSFVGPTGVGMSYNGPAVTTLHISCRATKLPIDKSLLEHFSMGSKCEHALVEVKTSSRCDDMGLVIHTVDLTYKTVNFGQFIHDLKNVAYNRYSDKFHKQLDDILD